MAATTTATAVPATATSTRATSPESMVALWAPLPGGCPPYELKVTAPPRARCSSEAMRMMTPSLGHGRPLLQQIN